MSVAFSLCTGRRLLLAILLTLAACQSTAPPPADPYLGLLPAGKQVSQAAQTFPISGTKGKSVGVVLTNSTDKQLEFLEKYVHELKTDPLLLYSPETDELVQPQFLMTSIVNKLKERFGRVEPLQDLRGARAVDYVALVDIALEFPHGFAHYFQYQIRVDILTRDVERIGSLSGSGYESYYCVGAMCAVPANFKAMKTAIAQFDSAADNALK
jgi:hypothetical protein